MATLSWRSILRVFSGMILVCAIAACRRSADGKPAFGLGASRPDKLPAMLNKELPFRYPPALYAEKAQGNVTLRLYIDKDGMVVNDSTRVVESSMIPALDSAALKGAPGLRFVPAQLHGVPIPVSILFPVYFRHPEAPPLAGDTLLKAISPSNAGTTQPPASNAQ